MHAVIDVNGMEGISVGGCHDLRGVLVVDSLVTVHLAAKVRLTHLVLMVIVITTTYHYNMHMIIVAAL